MDPQANRLTMRVAITNVYVPKQYAHQLKTCSSYYCATSTEVFPPTQGLGEAHTFMPMTLNFFLLFWKSLKSLCCPEMKESDSLLSYQTKSLTTVFDWP